MAEHQVTLPWPPAELNPNQKPHWAKKNRIAKEYGFSCWVLCRAAKLCAPETNGKIHVWIDLYPPDRRRRDEDNAIASIKHALDAVARAIDVDDSRFKLHPELREEVGGMVKIRLTAAQEAA